MLFFFHPDSVDEGGDGGFGESAGHPVDGGVLFVKKRARIGGKLKRIAENKILIVVEDLVFLQISNCHGGDDRHLVNAGSALAVEQYAGERKVTDRAFDHGVGAGERALDLQPIAATYDLAADGFGKSRFDTVSEPLGLELKRGHGDRLYMLWQARIRDRFVAIRKTGNRKHRRDKQRNA